MERIRFVPSFLKYFGLSQHNLFKSPLWPWRLNSGVFVHTIVSNFWDLSSNFVLFRIKNVFLLQRLFMPYKILYKRFKLNLPQSRWYVQTSPLENLFLFFHLSFTSKWETFNSLGEPDTLSSWMEWLYQSSRSLELHFKHSNKNTFHPPLAGNPLHYFSGRFERNAGSF